MGETNEDGDSQCPLCTENMDPTDRCLRPCSCGYQVCVWCWHQILERAAKDNVEGRCPACRTPYDKEKVIAAASSRKELLDLAANRKRSHKVKVKAKATGSRKHLSNVRVMQRNLVYVVNFPLNLADKENLEKREFFGQYGQILKVATSCSSSQSGRHVHNGPTANVYVTYFREEDARLCIRAIHGCILEGKLLRAYFGTNKYCNAWLKNMPCNNSGCVYLHEEGPEEDSLTKDEMVAKGGSKNQHFHELPHPPHPVVGIGLPAPLPEASTVPSSVPSVPQVLHPTTRALGRPSRSSGSPRKATSLPDAASWGVHGEAAVRKAIPTTNVPKKRPAGLTCPPACSSSSLSNPSLMGVLHSACAEPKKFAHIADKVDCHGFSNSNIRTTTADAIPLIQNDVEGSDVKEEAISLSEPLHCSNSLMRLNVGEISISLCSTPVNISPVHSENLVKQDNMLTSPMVLENTTDVMDKESTSIDSPIVADKIHANEAEALKTLTYESSIEGNNRLVAESSSLQVPKSTKDRNKSPRQWTSDNSIISDILTVDCNDDGSFCSPVDLGKLLRAGSSNSLTAENCNELPASWKSQSSSQSRFSFAQPKVQEQLHGTCKSNYPSFGEPIALSQTQFAENSGSIVYAEDKMDVSVNLNSLNSNSDYSMTISRKASSSSHEQTSSEVPSVYTESAATPAPLMSIKTARLDVPPGFSAPKITSPVSSCFSLQNAAANSTCHGMIALSSGLSPPSPAPAHATD